MDSAPLFDACAADKAGMNGLDRNQINETIAKLTRNTPKSFKEQEDKRKTEVVVAQIKKKLEELKRNVKYYERVGELARKRLKTLDLTVDKSRRWLHIDMDAFYASVEIRDNPSLADKPVAVGAKEMVSASNYIARQYGVRSAMPAFIARELCSKLVMVPVRMEKYKEVSDEIMAILAEYDPDMEQIASDEAYLDLTAYCTAHNLTSIQHLQQLCDEIKTRINQQTGLTASVGISYNRMLSKLSSEENKPDGVFILIDKDVDLFLEEKKIRKIHGIGPRAEYRLNLLGIETIKDIKENYVDLFYIDEKDNKEFDNLMKKSHGISQNEHTEKKEFGKSVSKSVTFAKTKNYAYCYAILCQCINGVYEELNKAGLACRNICVDIKSEKERDYSRGYRNQFYIIPKEEAMEEAKECMAKLIESCLDRIKLVRFAARMLIKKEDVEQSIFDSETQSKQKKSKKVKPRTEQSITTWFKRKDF